MAKIKNETIASRKAPFSCGVLAVVYVLGGLTLIYSGAISLFVGINMFSGALSLWLILFSVVQLFFGLGGVIAGAGIRNMREWGLYTLSSITIVPLVLFVTLVILSKFISGVEQIDFATTVGIIVETLLFVYIWFAYRRWYTVDVTNSFEWSIIAKKALRVMATSVILIALIIVAAFFIVASYVKNDSIFKSEGIGAQLKQDVKNVVENKLSENQTEKYYAGWKGYENRVYANFSVGYPAVWSVDEFEPKTGNILKMVQFSPEKTFPKLFREGVEVKIIKNDSGLDLTRFVSEDNKNFWGVKSEKTYFLGNEAVEVTIDQSNATGSETSFSDGWYIKSGNLIVKISATSTSKTAYKNYENIFGMILDGIKFK